jgi:uncharacterized protein (DUF1015 family)
MLVPNFLPFRGLRYRPGTDLSRVVAPPYDVIDEEERVALEGTDEHNSVRLILPRDGGPGDDPTSRYDRAAALLARWRAEGVLQVDREASFYSYRMTTSGDTARCTAGVIGSLSLPSGGDEDEILPHEQTLAKARSDRRSLLRATRANLDPIWGLSLGVGLTAAVAEVGGPVETAVDPEGTVHELQRITDPDHISTIRSIVRSDRLLIADGHHRYGTACAFKDEDHFCSGAIGIMAFVVELSAEQLSIRPIHRLVTGGPATDPVRLRRWIASAFDVEPAGVASADGLDALTVSMERRAALGLVDREGLALLVPRPDWLASALHDVSPLLHDVDSARLDAAFRVLKAEEVESTGDPVIGYRDDVHAVAALVEKGAADAAILLRPVDVETIRAVASAGLRMPPKTTYFAPKPRTGMVFRALDD